VTKRVLQHCHQAFESQFKKLYADKESEQKAAAALAASEKEVCKQEFYYFSILQTVAQSNDNLAFTLARNISRIKEIEKFRVAA